jgi:hypothetical protein
MAFKKDHVYIQRGRLTNALRTGHDAALGKAPISAPNIAYISSRTYDAKSGYLQSFHWFGPTRFHISHPMRNFHRMQRVSCSVHTLTGYMSGPFMYEIMKKGR